jgi:signal transduction histidine kinase
LPILVTGLVLAGFYVASIDRIAEASGQLAVLNRKLDAAQTLDTAAARYGMRVAQVIYEGREQQGDLRAARLDMERGFVRLAQEARDRAAAAPSGAETRALLADVESTRRMLELYHAIDLSASRAFVLKRDGRVDEAMEVYRREVDFRLGTELTALLDDAIANDKQRLERSLADWTTTSDAAKTAGYVFILIFVLAVLLSWFLLARLGGRHAPALAVAFEARAEELREANRRLRETDSRRAQFLADVSHELRTPLTILRGEADVALLPASSPDEQRHALERIQSQAGDMAQLLDELIAFARSDADAQALSLSRILLDDVLATAVEEGETLAEPREVTIGLTLADKGQWIDADSRRLKQALIIGIDNAINHSPPGSRIDVQLSRRENQAVVTIRDQGPGLYDVDASRVFDRFYRGENSRNSFGLGIGLAIAKGIVEQHNGTISLANLADGGAVLTVSLPVPKEQRS